MARMPLRTRVFTAALDRFGHHGIETLDLAGIVRERALVHPTTRPFSWVTGPLADDVRIADTSFVARDGATVAVRVYRPERAPHPSPAVVFFHGGGWVLGSTHRYDPLCSAMASEVPAVVVNVDYRMAPEHRAPQAVLDCVDALRWVGAEASGLGIDVRRLAVCGDSAGGNLAAVATHVLRDDGGPRLVHQALIYPATDATSSFPSVREHADGRVLTRRSIDAFVDHYLAGSGLAKGDPLVSPLWATDHSGLPPALVQTADLDPLRDEGVAYAEALRRAGVPVRSTTYLGVPHGFASFPGATTCGFQAREELFSELRRHLHG
jgi:acetyl esterase